MDATTNAVGMTHDEDLVRGIPDSREPFDEGRFQTALVRAMQSPQDVTQEDLIVLKAHAGALVVARTIAARDRVLLAPPPLPPRQEQTKGQRYTVAVTKAILANLAPILTKVKAQQAEHAATLLSQQGQITVLIDLLSSVM